MISTIAPETSLLNSLRASEERFRNLVESSSDWIWEVDHNGIYIYCSPQCFSMLGYQPEELIGKTPFDLMPPEEAQRIRKTFHNIIAEKRSFSHLENINIHKAGHQLIMETSGIPFFAEQGDLLGFRGIDRDITARKAAEANTRRQAQIIDQIHDSVIATDMQGIVNSWNKGAERLFGISKDKALGQHISLIYPEDEHAFLQQQVIAPLLATGFHDARVRMLRNNGTIFHVHLSLLLLYDEQHKPEGIIGYSMDISSQVKAEQALYQSNQQFSAFISAMPDIAFILNEQGQYLAIYGTKHQLLIQDAKSLLNKYVQDVLPHPLGQQVVKTIRATLNSNDTHVLEYELELAQGKCYFEGRVAPMFNKAEESRQVVWVARDITEKKLALQSLQESEQRFRQIFEKMPNIAVQGYNCHREVIYWNKTSEKIYGYTKKEAIGQKLEDLIIPADLKENFIMATENFFYRNIPIPAGELLLKRRDGSSIPVFSSHIKLGDTPAQTEMFCIDIDLTDAKKANAAIEQLAFYDPLTDLPNRRLFLDRLAQQQKLSERHSSYMSILFLDIDHFKTLNDSLGHSLGDLLLIEVGRRIQNVTLNQGTVARLGGDEFVVLLNKLSPDQIVAAKQAQDIAEKIMAELLFPINVLLYEYIITTSIGITLFSGSDNSADTLLKQADTAMYQAKTAGRNTYQFFHPSMQIAADARLIIEKDLRQALQHNELELYYQPQFDIYGNITGAEALLRWQHPTQGMMSPAEFIPVAEEAGVIIAIGDWIITTACKQLHQWEKQGLPKGFHLAINVSPKQFRVQAFVPHLQQQINQSAINPEHLTLELTEGIVIDNIQQTISKMRDLKSTGVKFSIDDFGTGYSSLVYLKQLPLDQLKIDQAFIRDIETDPNDAVIVEAIITMAKLLGFEVIAEGVETLEQLAFLQSQGCQNYQGYYFCKPLPEVEFSAKLKMAVNNTTVLKGLIDIPHEAGYI